MSSTPKKPVRKKRKLENQNESASAQGIEPHKTGGHISLQDDLADMDASGDDESIDGIIGGLEDDSVDGSEKQPVADPFDTHFQHPDENYLARAIETAPRDWRVHKRPIAHDMTAIATYPNVSQDTNVEFAVSKSPKDLMVGPTAISSNPADCAYFLPAETKTSKICVGHCPGIRSPNRLTRTIHI